KMTSIQAETARLGSALMQRSIPAPMPNITVPAPLPDGRRISPRPDRAGISLHGGDHRLGEPCGAGLAAVEHDGCRVLPCGAGGGARPVRQAGDLQHRPEPALAKAGGSQFTSGDFTGMLA